MSDEDTKKRMTELLDDTVEFYENNPRSIINKHCVWNDGAGNHCAVGRHLLSEYKERGSFLSWNRSTAVDLANDIENDGTYTNGKGEYLTEMDDVLKPEVRGFPLSFWTGLQHLHDSDYYWNDHGLSDAGDEYRECILDRINDDFYYIAKDDEI